MPLLTKLHIEYVVRDLCLSWSDFSAGLIEKFRNPAAAASKRGHHIGYIFFILTFVFFVGSQYKKGEDVILWLNKVGPYHNPQEAYSFYTLPFCAPEERLEPRTKFAGIGEALEGTEFVNSDVHIDFAINRAVTPICSMQLDEASAEFFSYAVSS